jgi:hypothetical protein
MNENAPGVVDAVSSAADTMLGPKNPPVNMALRGMGEVMRRGDPMNVMGGPTAMTLAHGTPATWAAEAAAPLGRARRAFARTGDGAASKGEGLYAAERAGTGEAYRVGLVAEKAVDGAHPGNLYALDYPDELVPRTLNFDAPLSAQTPEVQEALRAKGYWPEVSVSDIPENPGWGTLGGARTRQSLSVRGEPVEWFDAGVNPLDQFTGERLYHSLATINGGNVEAASRALAEAGIPAHKYRDGATRGLNDGGTYNFVVYEPEKNLKTLGRYPNLEEFLKAHPEVPR